MVLFNRTERVRRESSLNVMFRAFVPHPAVGFAVAGVDADGLLAVLHRSGVVPQFTVGCSSATTKHEGDSGEAAKRGSWLHAHLLQ